MAINSEAIYATRPWKIYGESPAVAVPAGTSFNESKRQGLTFNDVRFTTKGKTLYTFFMGWPETGQVTIKPLAANNAHGAGKIENVELLGFGKVDFTRDNDGLKITLPAQKPCDHAYALKLSGRDYFPVRVVLKALNVNHRLNNPTFGFEPVWKLFPDLIKVYPMSDISERVDKPIFKGTHHQLKISTGGVPAAG